MADNVAITAGSGTTIATENLTINSTAAQVEQVKLVFGPLDTYTGQQGGRLVDGSATAAAGFTDPRPNTASVSKTLTITASSYTANFALGGIIDFGAIARASGGGLLITGATLADSGQVNAQIDLLLFNADPTNGTYTDHGAITANYTDTKMIQGVVPFYVYTNIAATESVSHVDLQTQIVLNGTQHLYGVMIVRTASTFASTTGLTVTLDYIAD